MGDREEIFPIEEDTNGCLEFMAGNIKNMIGPNYGFALIVYPMKDGKSGYCHYVSDCQREDMIKALRDQADILESEGDIRTDNVKH